MILQIDRSNNRQHDQGIVFLGFKLITGDERMNYVHGLNNCKQSRHGPDRFGTMTWIIFFAERVQPLRIFKTSEWAKEIKKNLPVAIYNPGCRGYCNTARFTIASPDEFSQDERMKAKLLRLFEVAKGKTSLSMVESPQKRNFTLRSFSS